MIALIILFCTGLISMFVAFAKKDYIVEVIASTGLLGSLFALIYESSNGIDILPNYSGLNFDSNAVMFSSVAIIFTIMLLWSGLKPLTENKEHVGDHISLLLFSLCGALIMSAFNNFFMFFLGLEILSIPVYVLAGMNKKDALSSEASLKYFLTGAFSTGILLFGIAWIYGATGSFEMADIKSFLFTEGASHPFLGVGLIMVLAAFLFKAGAVPFHFWNPDVYTGSPATIMGFMATVIKVAAFIALLRLFPDTLSGAFDIWGPLVIAASVLSMFVGNLSALKQTRVRRLLAYSSIAHVGYTMLAVFSFQSVGSFEYHFNVYYYLMAYGLSTIILVTIMNIVNDHDDSIDNWSGIARKYPLLGVFAFVALLSLAGVPPMMGFFGKYLVFSQAIGEYPIIVAIALINSAIAIYYYLKLAIVTLRKAETVKSELNITYIQWLVMIACTITLMLGGFLVQ